MTLEVGSPVGLYRHGGLALNPCEMRPVSLCAMQVCICIVKCTSTFTHMFFMRDQLAGMVEDIASPVLIPMHRRVHFKVDSKMYGTIYATCLNLGGCSFLVVRFWPYHFCRIFCVPRTVHRQNIATLDTNAIRSKILPPRWFDVGAPPFSPQIQC